jgi:UTP:GlnB (protein PII) uridylyltransferase
MENNAFLPITDPKEIKALLEELPLVVNEEKFIDLVTGFPRRYLLNTPRMELIKHFLLLQGLLDQTAISSMSREGAGENWTLVLGTRDRESLFTSISGALSCFGASICSAEGFANRAGLGLDIFRFQDPAGLFEDSSQREKIQESIEAISGNSESFENEFCRRWNCSGAVDTTAISVVVDNDSHPTASHLRFQGPDHFGLLFVLSRLLTDRGHVIGVVSISTEGDQVHDDFYITQNGEKLNAKEFLMVSRKLQIFMEDALSHRQDISVIFQ